MPLPNYRILEFRCVSNVSQSSQARRKVYVVDSRTGRLRLQVVDLDRKPKPIDSRERFVQREPVFRKEFLFELLVPTRRKPPIKSQWFALAPAKARTMRHKFYSSADSSGSDHRYSCDCLCN